MGQAPPAAAGEEVARAERSWVDTALPSTDTWRALLAASYLVTIPRKLTNLK